MRFEHIGLQESGAFSSLAVDHMTNAEEIRKWWPESVEEGSVLPLIEAKRAFSPDARRTLHHTLRRQYELAGIPIIGLLDNRIEALLSEKTFTVTTGHQLNLATGPLYFIYKIAHVLKLARTLKESHPGFDFVPIYWMATEDHDLEEIDHFNTTGQKYSWKTNQTGAVGRMTIDSTDWIDALEKDLIPSDFAGKWIRMLRESYSEGKTLSEATRILVHQLFADHGLVILDADDRELKTAFADVALKEIYTSVVEKGVSAFESRAKQYFQQVNPRAINLFYLDDSGRYRMERSGDQIELIGKGMISQEELIEELNDHPERFSPNVLLRPIYQELILPNIAYIGGGAEVAYWLELAKVFDALDLPRPLLLLRNSAQWIREVQQRKAIKLGLKEADLLRQPEELFHQMVQEKSSLSMELDEAFSGLEEIFKTVRKLANKTDKSFLGAVNAQEAKQFKGYWNLKKRLIKAEKRRNQDIEERLHKLFDQMNAGARLQERKLNVSELIAENGLEWIDPLIDAMPAIHSEFILMIEEH